jgi:AraC family transcriptional regulator of adaptative response/methylated-DNA-[protein]-cysteine methyltransferase
MHPRVVIETVGTPLGPMLAGVAEHGDARASLCLLEFTDRPRLARELADLARLVGPVERRGEFEVGTPAADLLEAVAAQLEAYFAGERSGFDLPLHTPGTAFQRAVWAELLRIGHGRTSTYGSIAQALGRPGAQRAVGAANGANRVSIVVPCHRVIDASGRLHGYGGGLERKRRLLELERGGLFAHAAPPPGAVVLEDRA